MKSNNHRGVTLVEILVISGLLILIIGKLIDIGMSGSRIMDESSKLIRLQNGIRAVVENMIQDVNASIVFLNPSNQQLTLARYMGPVDDDLVLLNMTSSNPEFPYFVQEAQTKVLQKVLFVEYQFHDPASGTVNIQFLQDKPGAISRIAKEGVLEAFDSPEGAPYVIDKYTVNKEALTTLQKRVLAEKVTYFNMDYYGYDADSGQLRTVGELGGGDSVAARVAMVALHMKAEDPYEQENRLDPNMELYTKIWSFRQIMNNKYPEYFGHMDEDLRF